MKMLILTIILVSNAVFASPSNPYVREMTLTSQNNKTFTVEVKVYGSDPSKKQIINLILEEVLEETASQYTKAGFLNNRQIVFSRFDKKMKKLNLVYDGISLLGLKKENGKTVDIE